MLVEVFEQKIEAKLDEVRAAHDLEARESTHFQMGLRVSRDAKCVDKPRNCAVYTRI